MADCQHECENRITKLESFSKNQEVVINQLQEKLSICEKQSRAMALALFGCKETNTKGLVEQMSECKTMANDLQFWKRFITVSISIGAGILFIVRAVGLDKLFKKIIGE